MKYTIKNFKKFDQQGVTFDLSPITFLTGCNCSGKSSVVKSLMLLGDYFKRVKISYKRDGGSDKSVLIDQPLVFYVGNHKLGGFSTALNNRNTNGTMSFSYTTYSKLLHKNVVVTLSFVLNEDNQQTSNGKLNEISLKLENGDVFYQGGRDSKGKFCHKLLDLSVIRENYMDRMYQAVLHGLKSDLKAYEECPPVERESVEEYKKEQENQKLIDERIKYLSPLSSNDEDKEVHSKMLGLSFRVLNSDRRVFNDDNILALKKYKTVFYLPWFDILCDVKKSDVRSVMMEKLKGCELTEDLKYNLDFVLTAFEKSESENFIEFFTTIEKESLVFVKPEHEGLLYVLNWVLAHSKNEYDELTRVCGVAERYYIEQRFVDKIKLDNIFGVLAEAYAKIDPSFPKVVSIDGLFVSFPNELYYCFQSYFSHIWEEVLIEDVPCCISNIMYVGSERAVSKRLYSFDHEDADLSNLIQQYVDLKNQIDDNIEKIKQDYISNKKHNLIELCNCKEISKVEMEKQLQDFESSINENFNQVYFVDIWLKKLGIGNSICIDKISDSVGTTIGCSISILKDGGKYSVADEGYGCIQILSVLLAIQNAIFRTFINHFTIWEHNPMADGQVECCVVIEEPENHLHPRLQSLLADMFLDAYKKINIHFIVETHSEYLIRKSQVLVSKMGYSTNNETADKCPFQTYYIPTDELPYSLGYRKDGKFAESFGPGFYDESANLTFEIM